MDKATTQQDALQDDLDELWGNRVIAAPKVKRRKIEDATEEDSFMAMNGGGSSIVIVMIS